MELWGKQKKIQFRHEFKNILISVHLVENLKKLFENFHKSSNSEQKAIVCGKVCIGHVKLF